jgi:hypothetical protein
MATVCAGRSPWPTPGVHAANVRHRARSAEGHWRDGHRHVTFFAEIDLGTETTEVLVDKVKRYDLIAANTAWRWPVLFVLPTLRREQNLQRQLWDRGAPIYVAVATTAHDMLTETRQSPGDPVWQLHGHDGPRVRLVQLPHTDAATADFDPTTLPEVTVEPGRRARVQRPPLGLDGLGEGGVLDEQAEFDVGVLGAVGEVGAGQHHPLWTQCPCRPERHRNPC